MQDWLTLIAVVLVVLSVQRCTLDPDVAELVIVRASKALREVNVVQLRVVTLGLETSLDDTLLETIFVECRRGFHLL